MTPSRSTSWLRPRAAALFVSAALAMACFSAPITYGQTKFTQLRALSGADGINSRAPVTFGADGKLYGTTGTTVFRINTDGTNFTVLHTFNGSSDGNNPQGSPVIPASDGMLYGTTYQVGSAYTGTIYRLNTDGTGFQVVHTFDGGSGGGSPWAGVIQASDGRLYGTVVYGGAYNGGAVFGMNLDGSGYQILYSFNYTNGGNNPQCRLLQAKDGRLYGTTNIYGANGNEHGAVFGINLNGSGFVILHYFGDGSLANDGASPIAGVMQGVDGRLYGQTQGGGTTGGGVIYSVNTDGSGYTLLHSFNSSAEGNNGYDMVPSQGSDGTLYSAVGGFNSPGQGSVFKMNPDGTGFTVLQAFNASTNTGGYPEGGVTRGPDGRLYGTSYYGTSTNGGAIYALATLPLQTLTIEGTDVTGGTIDPNTDCSRDGDVTWLPAYAANRSHPWGNIQGTTGWISRVADMASAPTTSGSNPETLDFRIRFYAPSDISNAQLKYQINPDNYGDIYLNGTKLNATTIVGGSGVDATATITNANIVAGLNTIIVRLTDTGGLLGINYRVDLQGYGSTAFQRLVAPPAVTNITSSLASGSYKAGTVVPIQLPFTDAVTVTGTPTLTLSDGGTASYASGSGSTTLTFNYTVQAGQNSTRLDYASTSALALNGGTIISSAADAQAANLILPSPGGSGSLGANTALVIDTTAPVLNLPANITTTATSSAGATATFTASATDNFSTPTISYSQASGSTFPVGTTTVTVTATDAAGNTATGSFTVTVNPAMATITFTTPIYTYDGTAKPATATTSPSGLPVTFTYDGGSSSAPVNAGAHSVAAAVNQSWITGSANGSLTINPAAASVTISNTTQSYDGTPKSVTVSTAPSGLATKVTYNGSTTAPSAIGSYSVVATVTDTNYTGTNSATLQIKDTTPPVLSLPANITAEATSATGATVAFTATATDNVDGALPVTLTPASGSMFPLGTTTVTATATDHAGNTVTGSFTVTVRDTTPPVISVTSGADFTENFNGFTNGTPYVPQYQSGLQEEYNGDIPGWSKSGFHEVHAVNLDGQSNWAVMIWQDNVITSTRTTTDNASGSDYVVHFSAGPAVSADPNQATTAADGLLVQILRADNSVLKSFTYLPGAWTGAPALVPVSFHYTGDGTGPVHVQVGPSNFNSGHFGGTIDDLSITPSTPADITLEATSASGAVATWGAAAYDLVSGNVPVTASTPSGSTFALGTTTVTLTATDAAGNTATTSFNVIVKDTTAPTLTVPTNIAQDATSAAGAVVTFAATASDAVTASPTISYSQNSGTTFPLGTTTVTVTATDAAGNTCTGSFTVTINQAAANITLTTPAYTYDGTQKVATATANYNVPVSFTYGGSSTAPTAAGTYAVVATVNQPWIAGTANGTLTIAAAPLSVTAASETKVYGSADPALAFAVTGGTLFGADSLSGALVRAPGENVGNYAIGQGSLTAGANYALTYVGAALTITPKPASVAPAAATKVYGSADPALTGTLSGFLPSDNVTAVYTRTAGENVVGGPYTISATLSPAGVLSNYAITPSTATFTITPATLAVTANAQTKVYGAADPALSYVATGFQFSDNAAGVLSGGLKRAPGETVAGGPYAIAQGTLTSNSNYTVAFTGSALTITPATLAVTANAQTKVYGSADPALTYGVNGLQFSDTATSVLTGALTRVPGETVKGSPYAIQQGTLAANTNYTVAYTGANLTITAATPTISVKGYTGIYDGKPHGATGTATGVNGADLSSLLALGATYTNVPGGTANWTFHDPAGNYVDQSGNVAITLTQAAATIVVTPYGVTYDGKSHTATGTATGVNNEPLAGLVLAGTTHTNAGFYSTDAWTFSDAAGNYANAGATITDTIAKAPVTISLAPLAQVYDGTPKSVTATTVETPATSSLTVVITYNGSSTAPTLPGSYTVVATVVDPNYAGTVTATETVGVTALVRHAISLDGEIDGSIQVLLPENDTLNGEAMVSGDLLVPGTPTVRLNGHPTYGSTVDYSGNSAPSNYTVTLNGKAVLRHVDRRVDALPLPTVAAPPIPTGKRNVTVDDHNPNPGDFSTIDNLTVHLDDRASLTIPAGTYGKLTIDGGGTVVLGVAGATTPAVYNLQGFTANGDSRIQIAGPVIITVATGVQLNGGLGNSAHPEWLTLQIASGGVTLNGETPFYGYIVAPTASAPATNKGDHDASEGDKDGNPTGTSGTVIINGDASVTGGVVADRLVINGHGLLVQPGVVPPKSGGDRD